MSRRPGLHAPGGQLSEGVRRAIGFGLSPGNSVSGGPQASPRDVKQRFSGPREFYGQNSAVPGEPSLTDCSEYPADYQVQRVRMISPPLRAVRSCTDDTSVT
jgi:hypothetical protein